MEHGVSEADPPDSPPPSSIRQQHPRGEGHDSATSYSRTSTGCVKTDDGLPTACGATGGRLTTTILREMQRRGQNLGLITVCAAGAMGFAMVVERG